MMEKMMKSDPKARSTLIEHNLRLVVYIARKFENTGIGIEDLISIGTIGLIKAVNSFNPEKKIKLATYASRCIENEILMVLRRTNRLKLEVSFDEPLNTDWDGNELLLSDILGTEPDIVSRDLDNDAERQMLHDAIRRLNAREREIIELRYGMADGREHTQKEVADLLGISQSYISRLEKRIIGKLHNGFVLERFGSIGNFGTIAVVLLERLHVFVHARFKIGLVKHVQCGAEFLSNFHHIAAADEKMIVFHFSSKGQNLAQFHGGKAISLLVQVRYGE